MKAEDCLKFNECSKITMILDHDWLDFQYAEKILQVCGECKGG